MDLPVLTKHRNSDRRRQNAGYLHCPDHVIVARRLDNQAMRNPESNGVPYTVSRQRQEIPRPVPTARSIGETKAQKGIDNLMKE